MTKANAVFAAADLPLRDHARIDCAPVYPLQRMKFGQVLVRSIDQWFVGKQCKHSLGTSITTVQALWRDLRESWQIRFDIRFNLLPLDSKLNDIVPRRPFGIFCMSNIIKWAVSGSVISAVFGWETSEHFPRSKSSTLHHDGKLW